MSTSQHTAEGGSAIAAKLAPPAGVSIATVMGMPVSDVLMWATLFYTVLMIGHKLYQIYKDVRGSSSQS
jgi:hypothetical protein